MRSKRTNNTSTRQTGARAATEERDENDQDEDEVMDGPGRPTRSRRGTAAAASRNTTVFAEPEEASEDEELSVDKDDSDVGEEVEGDGEEIEGEIEEAGEAKITKDGELLGGKFMLFNLADQQKILCCRDVGVTKSCATNILGLKERFRFPSRA